VLFHTEVQNVFVKSSVPEDALQTVQGWQLSMFFILVGSHCWLHLKQMVQC